MYKLAAAVLVLFALCLFGYHYYRFSDRCYELVPTSSVPDRKYALTKQLFKDLQLPGLVLFYPGSHGNVRISFQLGSNGRIQGSHRRISDPYDCVTLFECDEITDELILKIYKSYERKQNSCSRTAQDP